MTAPTEAEGINLYFTSHITHTLNHLKKDPFLCKVLWSFLLSEKKVKNHICRILVEWNLSPRNWSNYYEMKDMCFHAFSFLTTWIFTRDFPRLSCLVLHTLPFLSTVINVFVIIVLKGKGEKKKRLHSKRQDVLEGQWDPSSQRLVHVLLIVLINRMCMHEPKRKV